MNKTNEEKIVPSLWFSAYDGNIAKVLEYYKHIFGNECKVGNVMNLGETPSGKTEMAYVKIFGKTYSFMNTAEPHHKFNDAISFTIYCKDQNEIDRYWDYFMKEGKESMCGWCEDAFGLRWQIVPENLGELMSRPNGWKVMMSQKKIVIDEYLK
jgi:predicted 3-demethylubiquinone-9 3-methyltransferase (glyoxalase superfamily)